jgi:hypothetical protein
MYSLLCRYARISLLGSSELKVKAGLSRNKSTRGMLKGVLESNKTLQKILLVLVLMGTCLDPLCAHVQNSNLWYKPESPVGTRCKPRLLSTCLGTR